MVGEYVFYIMCGHTYLTIIQLTCAEYYCETDESEFRDAGDSEG